MYNLLIGGAAGQGVDTTTGILEKLLKRAGFRVFTIRDFMSRIRGGHNFALVGFGTENILSHSDMVDGIVAMTGETVELHKDLLKPDGFIICDRSIKTLDPRAIDIDIGGIAAELGNPHVAGTAAIGIILKLFGMSLPKEGGIFESFIVSQYVGVNLKAVTAGYEAAETRNELAARSDSKAMALGALAAGLRFMKKAVNYKGYALVDILQPCVSFNKFNTYEYYSKRVYRLENDYDPTDKISAIQKTMEFGDRIPLGIIYLEQREAFHDKNKTLKKGVPLISLKTDQEVLTRLVESLG